MKEYWLEKHIYSHVLLTDYKGDEVIGKSSRWGLRQVTRVEVTYEEHSRLMGLQTQCTEKDPVSLQHYCQHCFDLIMKK